MYDDYKIHDRSVRIRLEASASRRPGWRKPWAVEAGSWRADATTEKAAADTLAERLRAFLTHYEHARLLSFRNYTAVLEINLGDDYNSLTWHRRVMHPDRHIDTSTIYDAANWDDAEEQARYDLVHRTTDWHDDDSVHAAAAYLSQGPYRRDGQYGMGELYRYAAWQRAVRAAMEAGRDDSYEWASAHEQEFAIPRPVESDITLE